MDASRSSSPLPPAYEVAQIPTETEIYALSPEGFNTILVLPPSSSPDSRPKYHISVALNVLNPFSFITTVRKGAGESALVIGEFEMGISTLPGTVSMQGVTKFLQQVWGEHEWNVHVWRFAADSGRHIRWVQVSSDPGLYNGVLAKNHHVKIAQYQGATLKRRPKSTSLTFSIAEGQAYFDDIILSILILERKRFRPPAPKVGGLNENAWWS